MFDAPEKTTKYSPYSSSEGTYDTTRISLETIAAESGELREGEELEPFIDKENIDQAIAWCANELIKPLLEDPDVFVVFNLKGAEWFFNKLVVHIPELAARAKPITATSSTGYKQFGEIEDDRVEWLEPGEVEGKRLVLIEDINDSGQTANYIEQRATNEGATEVITIFLLEKMIEEAASHIPSYVLFKVIDEYLVGLGLDDGEDRFRNLENIYVLRAKAAAKL